MKPVRITLLAAALIGSFGCTAVPRGTIVGIGQIDRAIFVENAIRLTATIDSASYEGSGTRVRSYSYRIDDDKIYLFLISLPAPAGLSVFGDPSLDVTISPVLPRLYQVIDGSNGRVVGTVGPGQ